MGDLNWTSVLKLAATTGVFTTVLTLGVGWLRDWWRERSRNRAEAKYLALRLAVILEKFVSGCVFRMWHDKADMKEGRDLGYDLPPLESYPPDSPDWKSFHARNPKLASQVLSFPNEITSAELACEFTGMREGFPFASADETIVAGIKAWRLAQALRKNYGLDAVTLNVYSLEEAHEKLEERTEFNTAFDLYTYNLG
jgi:hypothetical protein